MDNNKIGSKEHLLNLARGYCDYNKLTGAAFGRKTGIEVRKMQKILKGDVIMNDDEARKISLTIRAPFEEKKCKAPSGKKNLPKGMYLTGDRILNDFMKATGISNKSLANTIMVMVAWDFIIRVGTRNFDWKSLEKEAVND